MLGFPAAATKVGNQSKPDIIPFSTLPAGTWPGQRTIAGTRNPPSITCLWPRQTASGPVGPSEVLCAVIRAERDNRIVFEPLVLDVSKHRPHDVVKLRHAGFLFRPAVLGCAHLLVLVRKVSNHVHSRGVQP